MVVDLFFLFIMYIFGIVGSWDNDTKLFMYSDVSALIAFFFFILKLQTLFSVGTDFVLSSVAFWTKACSCCPFVT